MVVAFWDRFGLLAFFDWELMCDDAEMKKNMWYLHFSLSSTECHQKIAKK